MTPAARRYPLAIVGAGALGLNFAARLAAVGPVAVVARTAARAAELRAGVTVGGQLFRPDAFGPDDLPEAEWAILLVKTYDTASAARTALAMQPRGVLSLQNGLVEAELRGVCGGLPAGQGITTEGAFREGARVAPSGAGETLLPPGFEAVAGLLAAAGLPPLEDCEDERALLAASDRDGARQERSGELERGIARARALRSIGRTDEARVEIDAVIESAGTEDLRPVTGRALLERAYLLQHSGDLPAAEHDLRAAYFNAVADSQARLAATAAVGLVDVLAALGRTEEAQAWAEHARAHIGAVDPALALDAALRQALGHVGAAADRPSTPNP